MNINAKALDIAVWSFFPYKSSFSLSIIIFFCLGLVYLFHFSLFVCVDLLIISYFPSPFPLLLPLHLIH